MTFELLVLTGAAWVAVVGWLLAGLRLAARFDRDGDSHPWLPPTPRAVVAWDDRGGPIFERRRLDRLARR